MAFDAKRLRRQLHLQGDHRRRLQLLRGAAPGSRCFLLGCGSSLRKVACDDLGRMLDNNSPVLAMKQAIIPFAPLVDFHLMSRYKFLDYNYHKHRPIIVAFTQRTKLYKGLADILMPLHHGGDFKMSITTTKAFDRWRMDQSFDRCCGPGMVYELGLYLAVHLGCREIVTIGVDFDGGKHFYVDKPAIHPRIKRRGQLHGKREELRQMAAGVPLWRDWLQSRGVTWKFLDVGQETPLRESLPAFVPKPGSR